MSRLRIIVLFLWLVCLAAAGSSYARDSRHQKHVRRARQNRRDDLLPPLATISQGTYVGYSQPVDNVTLDFFLGIRYAQPPLGDLRFAKPKPLNSSTDIINATTSGPSCLQNRLGAPYSEDCLYLNIMRPSGMATGTKLPVMFYIHGGAFQYNGANVRNGSRIVAESVVQRAPIVYVAINYRLGVFGFLGGSAMLAATKAGSATLNAGMYDTRLALKWVQDNIAAFGGDPARVTLVGQSAGAMIIGSHLLANGANTQGLFHAAIMESGSPASANTMRPDHPRLDMTFGNISVAVGCPEKPADLACLKGVDASQLSASANKVTVSFAVRPQLGLYPFMPVQDFQVDGFWTSAPPRDLVSARKFATVPIISGCNMDEGTTGAEQNLNNSTTFEKWFRTVAVVNTDNSTLVNKTLTRIFQLYPNNVTRGAPYLNPPNNASARTTDGSNPFFAPATNQFKRSAAIYAAYRYEAPHRKFILERYAAKNSGVWSFRFAQMDKQVQPYLGVTHQSELPYIFGNTTDLNSPGLYLPLSKTMQRAWISFVNLYDPRKLENLNWPPFTSSGRQALKFKGLDVSVISETFREDSLAYLKSKDAATILSS